jgi:hypothetical protein
MVDAFWKNDMLKVPASFDERVCKKKHESNHQAINGQGLHERQGQQQHATQVISYLWLSGNAIDAAARGNALSNTRADGS